MDEFTSTFRMLYKLIYNGVIQSEEGEYGLYISDEDLRVLGEKLIKITESISYTTDSQKKEVFEQLLIVLKNNYIKTATEEEKASRYFTDESNASSFFRGTRYNFNELPDWELFKIESPVY